MVARRLTDQRQLYNGGGRAGHGDGLADFGGGAFEEGQRGRAVVRQVRGAGERAHGAVAGFYLSAHYGRGGDDRAYSVFTVREGRIVALRDCRDRLEALQLAGLQP